jgi:hypothetical protein
MIGESRTVGFGIGPVSSDIPGGIMRLDRRIAVSAALAILAALSTTSSLYGQFVEYTQPGGDTAQGEVEQEALEQAAEEARWRLGGLRVDPWLALRNVSWHDNPSGATDDAAGTDSDVSASAGAGLRAYLHTGADVIWSAHVLPEYVWWADQTERRRVNGRYGIGVFAFFNRLALQATAQRSEQVRIVSAELPQESNTRSDDFGVSAEVALGSTLSLFAETGSTQVRNRLDDQEPTTGPPLDLLDRTEDRVRGGIRYRPGSRWRIGVGMEWTEASFESEARDLSNSGEAPTFDVAYQGPKFGASVAVALRSLEPEAGSDFVASDTTTGEARIGIEGNRLSPAVYLRRTLAFSIVEGYSHYDTDVVGVELGVTAGRRTAARGFAETGENDYTARSPAVPSRLDDVTSFGGSVVIQLWRSLALEVSGSRSDFDSNLPGQDRSLTTVGAGITFGQDRGDWY